MSKTVRFWLPVFLWAFVIFFFSELQVKPATQIYWQDFIVKKTAHLIEYAVLFLLLYRAFLNTIKVSKKYAAVYSFIIVVFYGATDELHQSFTPGREPKSRDVIIDGVGAGLAWVFLWKLLPKAPRRLKNLAKSLQVA